ncbi:MAG: glycosyltransferase family 39 protein [Xanthobacteraceae bacterium]
MKTGKEGLIDAAIGLARRRPQAVLAGVLALHLIVWTVLPLLVCGNLQLDLAETLALGKEWQLGYWKHPPLPWWLADLAYRLVGDERVVYLLGPLAAVGAMYVVWRFASEVVAPATALVAVLALEGIHFYNFSVPKFAHDHMLMVLWPLTGWRFYRALAQGRLRDWLLAGALLALCFWSKYTAFAFAATLGLFLLIDRDARAAWRTAGPYAMALAFLIVVAPHLWWLVESGFQPFRYVEARAVSASHGYQYLTFPLQWTAGQALTLLPAFALLALLWPRGTAAEPARENTVARRFVTVLALGPFMVTTVAALVLGRLPIAMWGFPLWSFAPLAALMWMPPEPRRHAAFARGFLVVLIAIPVAYAAVELLEPLVRDRPKATQFPGRLVAETITRQWREKTGAPLRYVGGAEVGTGPGEFAANNIAVYSPDRPHVIVHGNPHLSPWIDMADVERRGAVLAWEAPPGANSLPENIRGTFPRAELQPPLVLPRRTLFPVSPAVIHYAVVPPRP